MQYILKRAVFGAAQFWRLGIQPTLYPDVVKTPLFSILSHIAFIEYTIVNKKATPFYMNSARFL